ncbi:MAG TPA: C4-type zinc ribbon domain-containing protein [Nitrospiria bacterium]
MKDQLDQLIRLQGIESQIIGLTRESVAIPEKIDTARENLEAIKKEHLSVKTDSDNATQKRREKERELETCEGKIQKAREHQSAIKSNKEYQAHLQEIEVLKVEKGKIEEDLLLLMDEVESLVSREKGELGKVKAAEQDFETAQKTLGEKEQSIKVKLEQFEKQRETIASGVDEGILKKFRKLVSQGREKAVVPIENGSCGGCYMNLPPQLVAEVKTGNVILSCSQCQRILYWTEKLPDSAKVTAGGSD